MLPKKPCERERRIEDYQLYRERDQVIVKFEIIIKFFNDVVSVNRAMKLQINALRKERTMYDSIFKDLENQIKNEESLLLKILESVRATEAELKESSDYLRNMHQVLDRNRSNSIKELLVEQKSHFEQLKDVKSSRRSIEVRGLVRNKSIQPDNDGTTKQKSILRKFLVQSKKKNKPNKQGAIIDTIQTYQRMEKEKKIAEMENLIHDIKIRSEECDVLALVDSFHSVKEQNDRLYREYNELEKEVG
jgi:hypothetical protein